jgi:hypothetical protein
MASERLGGLSCFAGCTDRRGIVNETIGGTEFNPTTREVIRHDLTEDSITETIFIVGHLSRMVESLERKYLTGNEEQ